ncbi:hypothetical protein IFR05_016455 [Cadophora sp. M221]|nr:hypothetical protein IFR05_016455 [Cadophora sp. M221]
MTSAELQQLTNDYGNGRKSLYVVNLTYQAALISAGGAIETCKSVVVGKVKNAITVLRSPGYYAENNESLGFCIFNKVPIAAKVCMADYLENIFYEVSAYLFALDKFNDPDSQDPRLRGDPYEIDGEFFSGPTRFINHSCDPNLRIFAVVTDHANKPFHGLSFFALRDIEKETELTFDYTDGVSYKKDDRNIDDLTDKEWATTVTKCLCGAANCRGYLF